MTETIIVTGVGGYIGRHIAAQLLESGYPVIGTVRSIARAQTIRDAISATSNTSLLDFAEADLLSDRGWDSIMRRDNVVVHVASPFTLDEPKNENELIAPAVAGTERVMRAAEGAGVRRMVLTSSVVALYMGRGSGTYGPDSWSDVNARIGAYAKSKTLAEQAAWRLASGMDMELVTVLPGYVTGPALGGSPEGASAETIADMIRGRFPGVPDLCMGMVDVVDIARLHVDAISAPGVAGKRLIGSQATPTQMSLLAQTLRAAGYDNVPTRRLPTGMLRLLAPFSSEIRSLLPYLGVRPTFDTSLAADLCNWSAGPIEPGLLALAKQISARNV